MSRIRSVHPGFFTDENLVACGAYARLLFIGLGVEADDKGIFEWKPLTIKMRIFPADHVMVEDLLAELVNAGAVKQYEINDRKYGAIRNFRRFQKPKTPNDIHPATPEILAFVGLISETEEVKQGAFPPKGETIPPKGEKSPQMEDGGWREGEGKKDNYAFSGRVIRLTASDLKRWAGSYPALDLPALLQSRDDWLVDRPEPERRKWFNSTSNWLSRKQQEAATAERASSGMPIC